MIEFNATFLIAFFSFVIFIIIMNAIFYNPILNIIKNREDYINSNYEDAKRFADDARELETTRSAKLEQTRQKCAHEYRNATSEFNSTAGKNITEAAQNAKAVIKARKDELLKVENELSEKIKNSITDELSSKIVEKLTGITPGVKTE